MEYHWADDSKAGTILGWIDTTPLGWVKGLAVEGVSGRCSSRDATETVLRIARYTSSSLVILKIWKILFRGAEGLQVAIAAMLRLLTATP
jgi:hypothetical protein